MITVLPAGYHIEGGRHEAGLAWGTSLAVMPFERQHPRTSRTPFSAEKHWMPDLPVSIQNLEGRQPRVGGQADHSAMQHAGAGRLHVDHGRRKAHVIGAEQAATKPQAWCNPRAWPCQGWEIPTWHPWATNPPPVRLPLASQTGSPGHARSASIHCRHSDAEQGPGGDARLLGHQDHVHHRGRDRGGLPGGARGSRHGLDRRGHGRPAAGVTGPAIADPAVRALDLLADRGACERGRHADHRRADRPA